MTQLGLCYKMMFDIGFLASYLPNPSLITFSSLADLHLFINSFSLALKKLWTECILVAGDYVEK